MEVLCVDIIRFVKDAGLRLKMNMECDALKIPIRKSILLSRIHEGKMVLVRHALVVHIKCHFIKQE